MPIENWSDFQERFLASPQIGDAGKGALLQIVNITHKRGWDWYQTDKVGEFARAGERRPGRKASRLFLTLHYHQGELVAEWNYNRQGQPLYNIPNGRRSWTLTDLAHELSKPQSQYLGFTRLARVPGGLPNDYR